MSEKLCCKECGSPILPATAGKTGGLCMPCKNGTRARQDMSARMMAMPPEVRKTPEWRHLDWLNNAAFSGKTAKLSKPNKLYLALRWLHFGIEDGGLLAYFASDLSLLFSGACEGLEVLGLAKWSQAMVDARAAIFGSKPIPVKRSERRATLAALDPAIATYIEGQSAALDPQVLAGVLDSFAAEHRLVVDF